MSSSSSSKSTPCSTVGSPATDIARLDCTTSVLTEARRLYPPAWTLTRVLTTETTLASKTLPAGTILLYSPYVIRRREDLYPHPDRFDPDRWLSDHTTPPVSGCPHPLRRRSPQMYRRNFRYAGSHSRFGNHYRMLGTQPPPRHDRPTPTRRHPQAVSTAYATTPPLLPCR
jgi:hypothetical protein